MDSLGLYRRRRALQLHQSRLRAKELPVGQSAFHQSALSRYSQWNFIDLVERHGIGWHEKTLGQLFCDGSAREIVAMLRSEMERAGATLWLETEVGAVEHDGSAFRLTLRREGT